jgi:hypothetical protein
MRSNFDSHISQSGYSPAANAETAMTSADSHQFVRLNTKKKRMDPSVPQISCSETIAFPALMLKSSTILPKLFAGQHISKP